jgi:hypothetical protein
MVKKLAFAACLIGAASVHAQKLPDTQTLLSFRQHTVSQVLATSPITFKDVFAKGFTVDARGFGGLAFDGGGKPTGGVSFTHRFERIDFGFFGQFGAGRSVDCGLVLGYRF